MIPIEKFIKSTSNDYPLVALISIIYREHMIYLNREIKDMKVTAGQVPFIIQLLKKEDISQEDLATELHIDRGTVAKALRKLEIEGIVKRTVNDDNRRKYKISLTNSGEKIAKKIKEIDSCWENFVYNKISNDEKEIFIKNLKTIAIKSMELL